MNSKNQWIYFCLLCVCCVSLVFGRLQKKQEQTDSVKRNENSFIRMDLLSEKKDPMPPPRRNIFTFGNTRAGEEFSPEALEERIEEIMPGQNTEVQGEKAMSSLNLRYLGYVLSRKKIVGLIVFRGEALAVMEGDPITEGFTVSRISPDEIEVLGPDQEPMLFSIEGEFP